MNNKVKIIFSFLILAILIAGSFLLFKKGPDAKILSDNFSTFTATTTLIAGEKANEYKNTKGKFSLVYPENTEFKVYNEGNNSHTVLFEEKNSDRSFQIFFTPYEENTITASRIKIDIPSGEYTKPEEIVISGGTRAIIFYSQGQAGELRELWFIKNGYLYEITTYKEYDSWLSSVMQTWKFI